jgi:hypothetical protein
LVKSKITAATGGALVDNICPFSRWTDLILAQQSRARERTFYEQVFANGKCLCYTPRCSIYRFIQGASAKRGGNEAWAKASRGASARS